MPSAAVAAVVDFLPPHGFAAEFVAAFHGADYLLRGPVRGVRVLITVTTHRVRVLGLLLP